ncbi:MAG: DUF2202 domain-containing protein, partial [Deltaproteobacteria bacterium]|nr:DUF2202 domain-containing protein [Deltaproteobacteria bacterium]
LGMLFFHSNVAGRQGSENRKCANHNGLSSVIAGLPYEKLSDTEIARLMQMREEAKLDRDVYTILYEKWGLVIVPPKPEVGQLVLRPRSSAYIIGNLKSSNTAS